MLYTSKRVLPAGTKAECCLTSFQALRSSLSAKDLRPPLVDTVSRLHLKFRLRREMAPAINTPGREFEVFLSFRGLDTRVNFSSFLYNRLAKIGIHVFKDDKELRVGQKIGGNLLRALDDSQIYIPIFSQRFVSSPWCLREVAHMVDCTSKSDGKKETLPIFFDVEPDDVKLKTKLYRDALTEHEKKYSSHEVKRWRDALVGVPTRVGWKLEGKGMLSASKRVLPVGTKAECCLTSFRALRSSLSAKDLRPPLDDTAKDYALSPQCLRELAHMMELNESIGKPEILPIFYKVTPSNVKLRKELYVEDLEKHEQRHGNEIRQEWKEALRKVRAMEGCEVQGKRMLFAFKGMLQLGKKVEYCLTSFRALRSSSSAKDLRPPLVDTVEREANKFRGDIGCENDKRLLDADITEAIATFDKADLDATEFIRSKFKEAGTGLVFLGIGSIAYCVGVYYVAVGKNISSKKVDGPSPQQVPRDGNTVSAYGSG